MNIRAAQPTDIPAVSEIYNHYVLNSTCTFATEPEGDDYWRDWLASHKAPYSAIVAVEEDRVVGWGTLSRWNNRCAYRFSAENSVYVRHDCHRRGIGNVLLTELIALARGSGLQSLVAQIADHQAASETLHEAHGFRRVGCLEKIGYKFDRWIDVVIWQLRLEGGA